MKLPLAQAERQVAMQAASKELLSSLPPETLDRSVHLMRVGSEFTQHMSIRECLTIMSESPHMEYRLAGAGARFVVGSDDDTEEIAGEWRSGKYLVEALSK